MSDQPARLSFVLREPVEGGFIAGIAWELADQYKGNGVSLRAINVFARLQADATLAADGIEVDWKRHPEVEDA